MKRVTFARTPIMSTYLLAFVVGEFDYVEERDSNGVLVRVYTPVGKAEQGRFALEVSFDQSYCYTMSTVFSLTDSVGWCYAAIAIALLINTIGSTKINERICRTTIRYILNL